MSGGRWNYQQNSLGYEMFPGCDVCYGLGDDDSSKAVEDARDSLYITFGLKQRDDRDYE